MTVPDWNPAKYAQFSGLRLQPALDLLMRATTLPTGDVVDLGCGNGAMGPALRARFPDRIIHAIDNSPAMLDKARALGLYDAPLLADAATWRPDTPPALIYSNALCHWLDDHTTLFTRLGRSLAPGGTLAVQMPRQFMAPSHALLRQIAVDMFPRRFDFTDWQAPVAPPQDYARLLAPLGRTQVWETQYLQRLDAVENGHPVRHFTQPTAMRPFLAQLSSDEAARFTTAYEAALQAAYPEEADGSVLFAFRRVFFTLRLSGAT